VLTWSRHPTGRRASEDMPLDVVALINQSGGCLMAPSKSGHGGYRGVLPGVVGEDDGASDGDHSDGDSDDGDGNGSDTLRLLRADTSASVDAEPLSEDDRRGDCHIVSQHGMSSKLKRVSITSVAEADEETDDDDDDDTTTKVADHQPVVACLDDDVQDEQHTSGAVVAAVRATPAVVMPGYSRSVSQEIPEGYSRSVSHEIPEGYKALHQDSSAGDAQRQRRSRRSSSVVPESVRDDVIASCLPRPSIHIGVADCCRGVVAVPAMGACRRRCRWYGCDRRCP
jgi:hypothetical protein